MPCESCRKADLPECGYTINWFSPTPYTDDWSWHCDGFEEIVNGDQNGEIPNEQ
jgi:hypothetical protein